jgi:chromate transporter
VAEVGLGRVLREWTRIGLLGFGGPPAHVLMMRERFVRDLGWIDADEFQDALATTNLLPGPASTQLAIFCGWRVAGARGALVGGLGFVVPGLLLVIAASALLLGSDPPTAVLGLAGGVAAGVPAVAVHAGYGLVPASWARAVGRAGRVRWLIWVLLGSVTAAFFGAAVVVVILVCGVFELAFRDSGLQAGGPESGTHAIATGGLPSLVVAKTAAGVAGVGALAALAWTAAKVGALSFGGGFVIVPLMQSDALQHRWLTRTGFGTAVALGQVTPGPVTHTVAAVGYAAGGRGWAGVGAAVLAAAIAFAPSFVFVMAGVRHHERLRHDDRVRGFLDGAGPAAVGAIFGAAVALAMAISRPWQVAALVLVAVAVFWVRRSTPIALALAGVLGAVAVTWLALPLPR